MSDTPGPGLSLAMHDRCRRAERKGESMMASFKPTRRMDRDDTRSDLQRLQDDAAATMQSGWDFTAPIDTAAEDGQANFGFAETENEEE